MTQDQHSIEGLMALVRRFGEVEHAHRLEQAVDLLNDIEEYAEGLAHLQQRPLPEDEASITIQCKKCLAITNEGNGCELEGCPVGVRPMTVSACPGIDTRAEDYCAWRDEWNKGHAYPPADGDAFDAGFRYAWKRARPLPVREGTKYDDVLLPFLSLMRKELHANSRKGDRPGWLAMDANTALLEVYWHAAKLSAAVKNNDCPAIMEHSADVANMAMMVLDICGGLAFVELPSNNPCGCDATCRDRGPECRYLAPGVDLPDGAQPK